MGGSKRTVITTGVAAVAASVVVVAPESVLPMPEPPSFAIPSPTSTKYGDPELTSLSSGLADLLNPPVAVVTDAVNGVIDLVDPVLDISNAVALRVADGVNVIPLVGSPIAGQITTSYALITGLSNSAVPFATSIVRIPSDFVDQVAAGVPILTALGDQAASVVNASLALSTGAGITLYNYGVEQVQFFTGIDLPPINLDVATPSGSHDVSANAKSAPPLGGSGSGAKSGEIVPTGSVAEGGEEAGLDAGGGQEQNNQSVDDKKPTTTSAGTVEAQGEVRTSLQAEPGAEITNATDTSTDTGDNDTTEDSGSTNNTPPNAPPPPPGPPGPGEGPAGELNAPNALTAGANNGNGPEGDPHTT